MFIKRLHGDNYTYMFTSHTLTDNFGMFVYEHIRLSIFSINSSHGEVNKRRLLASNKCLSS